MRADGGLPAASRPWPLLASLQGWRPGWFAGDVAAGIMVTAVQVPSQMATARLAGLSPEIGFHAFIGGSLAFAIVGANRYMSVAGDSTIAPIFAAGLALVAVPGSTEYAGLASAFALTVGLILLLAGIMKLGWIADLVSVPVTTGFLAGVAVHIIVGQLPSVLGIAAPDGDLGQRVLEIVRRSRSLDPMALAIGLGVLATVVVAKRIGQHVPGALIGIVAATLAVLAFGLEARGIAVLGELPAGLPRPALPPLDPDTLFRVLPLAFVVAVVCMVQTAAVTRAYPSSPGRDPAIDKDYAGIGAGSILSGLLGGFPVDASPPSTAIVASAGGRSQLANLIAVALVMLLVVFGTDLLANVPVAALGGVLMFVGASIFRVGDMRDIWRRGRPEFALVVATILLVVVLPIQIGMGCAILLSLVHGLYVVARPRCVRLARIPGTTVWWPPSAHDPGEQVAGVLVLACGAPLHFTNAYHVRKTVKAVLAATEPRPTVIVLEASGVIDIDYTGARVMRQLVAELREDGRILAFARLGTQRAEAAAVASGLVEALGPRLIFRTVEEAVRALSSDRAQM